MKVLSLFDGMSCGQIALERAGIKYSEYYASEIEPNAIKITQKNYPSTKQIGDIREVDVTKLEDIDLVIGGTPCQNLSRAVINNLEHNQGLKGEKSSLFYEYVRILKKLKRINPNILFMLENVGSMLEEDKEIITETMGVEPLEINSNLVSAQDRLRYYWTNIDVNTDIQKKKAVLKDIMLPKQRVDLLEGKMKFWYEEDYEFHGNDKKIIATLNIKGHDILKRVYNSRGKCGTLTTCNGGNLQKKVLQDGKVRKLTPIEYERLQTVPDGYTNGVSNTQRYNMLGNGWTVDVIAHIFKHIRQEEK